MGCKHSTESHSSSSVRLKIDNKQVHRRVLPSQTLRSILEEEKIFSTYLIYAETIKNHKIEIHIEDQDETLGHLFPNFKELRDILVHTNPSSKKAPVQQEKEAEETPRARGISKRNSRPALFAFDRDKYKDTPTSHHRSFSKQRLTVSDPEANLNPKLIVFIFLDISLQEFQNSKYGDCPSFRFRSHTVFRWLTDSLYILLVPNQPTKTSFDFMKELKSPQENIENVLECPLFFICILCKDRSQSTEVFQEFTFNGRSFTPPKKFIQILRDVARDYRDLPLAFDSTFTDTANNFTFESSSSLTNISILRCFRDDIFSLIQLTSSALNIHELTIPKTNEWVYISLKEPLSKKQLNWFFNHGFQDPSCEYKWNQSLLELSAPSNIFLDFKLSYKILDWRQQGIHINWVLSCPEFVRYLNRSIANHQIHKSMRNSALEIFQKRLEDDSYKVPPALPQLLLQLSNLTEEELLRDSRFGSPLQGSHEEEGSESDSSAEEENMTVSISSRILLPTASISLGNTTQKSQTSSMGNHSPFYDQLSDIESLGSDNKTKQDPPMPDFLHRRSVPELLGSPTGNRTSLLFSGAQSPSSRSYSVSQPKSSVRSMASPQSPTRSIPNLETANSPRSIPNLETANSPRSIPNLETANSPRAIPNLETANSPRHIQSSQSSPKPIPNLGSITPLHSSPRPIPSARSSMASSQSSPKTVPNFGSITSSQSSPRPIPNLGSITPLQSSPKSIPSFKWGGSQSASPSRSYGMSQSAPNGSPLKQQSGSSSPDNDKKRRPFVRNLGSIGSLNVDDEAPSISYSFKRLNQYIYQLLIISCSYSEANADDYREFFKKLTAHFISHFGHLKTQPEFIEMKDVILKTGKLILNLNLSIQEKQKELLNSMIDFIKCYKSLKESYLHHKTGESRQEIVSFISSFRNCNTHPSRDTLFQALDQLAKLTKATLIDSLNDVSNQRAILKELNFLSKLLSQIIFEFLDLTQFDDSMDATVKSSIRVILECVEKSKPPEPEEIDFENLNDQYLTNIISSMVQITRTPGYQYLNGAVKDLFSSQRLNIIQCSQAKTTTSFLSSAKHISSILFHLHDMTKRKNGQGRLARCLDLIDFISIELDFEIFRAFQEKIQKTEINLFSKALSTAFGALYTITSITLYGLILAASEKAKLPKVSASLDIPSLDSIKNKPSPVNRKASFKNTDTSLLSRSPSQTSNPYETHRKNPSQSSNFSDISAPEFTPAASVSSGEAYTAVHSFSGESHSELSFEAGDIIYVKEKDHASGWWKGTHENGDVGWFPKNFLVGQ